MLPTSSVVVPVHGGKAHLPLFWQSLLETRPERCQIVIVDDASGFDLNAVFPGLAQENEVVVIRHDRPRGYAAAVNAGIAVSSGHCILLLNSDLIVLRDCLEKIINALVGDDNIGVVSATLLFPQTGRVQHAGLLFTETNHRHLFYGLSASDPLLRHNRDVQAAAFALVGLRRSVIDEIGSLDEHYFNGYEDIDFCFRLAKAGYRITVLSDAQAFHWERQSGAGRRIWRKDNVARLWRDWGKQIRPDLERFHAESWKRAVQVRPTIAEKSFTRIDLFGAPKSESVIPGPIIAESWDYRQNGAAPLWLPMIMPVSAVQHHRPFLYVVENIEDISENKYWFNLRRNYCSEELIADQCGNIILSSYDGI